MWGRGRYNAVGGLYDLVSLEPLLYRRPRRDSRSVSWTFNPGQALTLTVATA